VALVCRLGIPAAAKPELQRPKPVDFLVFVSRLKPQPAKILEILI
jgi:hypothetical protein